MCQGGLSMVAINGTPPHTMAGQKRSGVVACLRQVANKGGLIDFWPTHLHQSEARKQAPEQFSFAYIVVKRLKRVQADCQLLGYS